MTEQRDVQTFEAARPTLLGIAYRILGTLSDAEDAVQDTFVKWAKADRRRIENAGAWLTTSCTRRCLDLLRSAHRTRVSYVGAWLPEPIHTPDDSSAEGSIEFAQSLTTAFLLLLERLTPKERAAYLLHEVFEVSYSEVAATLDLPESACRKLVSRAKASIGRAKARHAVPAEQQEQFLKAFRSAVADGSTGELAALLSSDVRLSADGGGKATTIPNALRGKDHVLAFIGKGLRKYWADLEWNVMLLNGLRGIVLKEDGAPVATVSFAFDDAGNATGIYIMRNPDKLTGLHGIAIH